ncbi:proline oxidase [Pseudovirgaria hyperparasitica]|uniref:Proline dehydrogenase n=1 Tax=Pseudovirgaria hyperparasitica TaxID=470096 RepID=A0A6A6W006_9PEZI|nr:proline oxidase [Pseudovirgaria hyperparasitica]KAF2755479.1 proline oxidase [Pseudovirgaria hyperparasitica]
MATMRSQMHAARHFRTLTPTYVLSFSRSVQSSKPRSVALPASPFPSIPPHHAVSKPPITSPLSRLPASDVLRSYVITAMSSSPILLDACLALLTRMLQSKSALLNVDKNPILSWLLKKTFYAQFCAGENRAEIQSTMARIKDLGYKGVILEYALEVLGEKGQSSLSADSAETKAAVEHWRKGALQTVEICAPGDFVGIKWSGLGPYALQLLKQNKPPTPLMHDAITQLCDRASAKGVMLLNDAEEHATNIGIDSWNRALQRKYNTKERGRAIVYTTYQAYDRSTPVNLARDLAEAQKHNYILGVKLVRGAYLNSEPRHLLWATIEETHKCYDELTESLLKRQYGDMLRPADPENTTFPEVELVIATHNAESVRKARAIRDAQAANGEPRIKLAYAQLLGMADEVSCNLLDKTRGVSRPADVDTPFAYKCVSWGTTRECLNYLLRRAAENKDAASRTVGTRRAMGAEILRRVRSVFGAA